MMVVLPAALAVGLVLVLRLVHVVVPVGLLYDKFALIMAAPLHHLARMQALSPLTLVLAAVVVVDGLLMIGRRRVRIVVD